MNDVPEMRCDSCRHWNSENEDLPYRANGDALPVGLCERIPVFWDATEYVKGTDGKPADYVMRQRTAEHKDTLAFAQDGSDYMAHLYTMPEFFCAHFEAALASPPKE